MGYCKQLPPPWRLLNLFEFKNVGNNFDNFALAEFIFSNSNGWIILNIGMMSEILCYLVTGSDV